LLTRDKRELVLLLDRRRRLGRNSLPIKADRPLVHLIIGGGRPWNLPRHPNPSESQHQQHIVLFTFHPIYYGRNQKDYHCINKPAFSWE
jgi:hypothetical protein